MEKGIDRGHVHVEEEGASSIEKESKFNNGVVEYYDDKKEAGTIETIQPISNEVSDEQMAALLKKLGYDHMESITNIPEEIQYVASKIALMTPTEAIEIMKESAVYHKDDPNIPQEELDEYFRLSELDSSILDPHEQDYFDLMAMAGLLYWHSPYRAVRACVDPRDDTECSIETFRSYTLALIWAIIGSGFNEFFAHRLLTISINSAMVQMLLFPMGNLWAKFMPYWSFPVWKGKRIHINFPEPWNPKEQMFSTILFAICSGTFYTHYNILTQRMYYHESVSFGYQFFLSIGVQYLGLGFAGSLRRFVIYPAKAIWPSQLQTMALNKALFSRREEKNSKGFTRQTFFFICTAFIFFYQWIPSYLFQAVSTFNWMTWIKPNNFNLAMVTGSMGGVGLNPIASFDWNVINNYYCLITPFFSYMSQMVGALIATICVLAMYYSNQFNCQYLPMFSNSLFTNRGEPFEIDVILNKKYEVDNKKYQNYSPPYYSAGNIFCYGAFFASYPLLFAYYFISEWKIMYGAFKEWALAIWALTKKHTWVQAWKDEAHALEEFQDPHSRMMRRYKEVPDWWYYLVLVGAVAVGIGTVEGYHTNTPVWSLFMSIGLNAAFLIPITILEATSALQMGLNVLIEVIMGYALPGNPHALMIIKAFGYNIDGQADSYVGNLKLGHYAKIPPKALFRGQMLMILVQTFVCLGVLNWSISNIKDYCQPHQESKFTCPDAVTYYNSSVLWGAIGPKRIFEGVYPIMKWCWLIGAVVGVAFGIYKLALPRFYPLWLNPVIIVGGMLNMAPPYNLTYMTPGAIANFFSQFYMRKYRVRLWEKYNYVLSAGFSAGLVVSSIIIFFSVQYKDKSIHWWGNDVINAGIDAAGPAKRNITATSKGYFGPDPGNFP